MNHKVSIFVLILSFIIGCENLTTENAKISDPTKDSKSTPAEGVTPVTESTSKLVYLEQGWTNENKFRELSYYTSQGSRLIPYKWFLALEQPDNEGMFRDQKFIASLGFLNHRPQKEEALNVYKELNPDGLPVGFVKDLPRQDEEDKTEWMGFNCSTCHTGQIDFEGVTIRIDGAPAMADLQTFLEVMRKSLEATLSDDKKFKHFAEKVQSPNLKEELEIFSQSFSELVDRNYSPVRYGFARLDAFGAILKAVAHNLGKEVKWISNSGEPTYSDAPVSYPFIWDAPKLDWVQWNGAVNNAIARNAGEVIGVYGKIKGPNNDGKFTSSARIENLLDLEDWLKVLHSPKWPQNLLGEIDPNKKSKGETIYKKRCEGCHSLPLSDNRMTDPKENLHNEIFIKTRMVGLNKIDTDPRMAKNFANRTIDGNPGAMVLAGFVRVTIKPEIVKLKTELKSPGISQNRLKKLSKKLKEASGLHELPLECEQSDPPKYCKVPPSLVKHKLLAYKARPLNGIWATAPYLHNGSIPNLYQLLSPSERKEKFCVGSREFDPEKVGFESDSEKGCGKNFTFDTNLPGNSNTGHDYAKNLDDDELSYLLEFLKTL